MNWKILPCIALALALRPAAAGAESAEAAALGAQASFSETVFSGASPEPFKIKTDPNKWATLVKKVILEGEYTEPMFPYPGHMGLTRKRELINGSEQRDYVNVWGGKDVYGAFEGSYVSMVSENWAENKDGHYEIDQWLFRFGMDMSLWDSSHNRLVITKDSRVLEGNALEPYEDDDPRVADKRDELVAFWLSPEGVYPASFVSGGVREIPPLCNRYAPCNAAQKEIYRSMKSGTGIPADEKPGVYSGECRHTGRGYEAGDVHYGVGLIDVKDGTPIFGGRFAFHFAENPYVHYDLETARKEIPSKHPMVLQETYAYVNANPGGTTPWMYWTNKDSSTGALNLIGIWGIRHFFFCSLTPHSAQ